MTVRYEVGYTQRPDLRGLALQVAEPNRVPAVIALGSDEATYDYPVFGAVDTSAISLPDPDSATRRIVVEPAAAAVDINAGPYRAASGEELAVGKVSVQRAESNPEAGYLQTGYWALEADGEQVPAIFVARTSEPASNTDEVTLLFAFPEGSDELTVMAAAGSDDAAGFSIVLPTAS